MRVITENQMNDISSKVNFMMYTWYHPKLRDVSVIIWDKFTTHRGKVYWKSEDSDYVLTSAQVLLHMNKKIKRAGGINANIRFGRLSTSFKENGFVERKLKIIDNPFKKIKNQSCDCFT
jgi:hypothetical protein